MGCAGNDVNHGMADGDEGDDSCNGIARQGEKPLLHTWSLSIEEQFYLVWPVTFLLLSRWRILRLSSLVGIACAVSLAASAIMVAYHKEAAFFLAPYLAWELLLGAWLALLSPWPKIGARRAELR